MSHSDPCGVYIEPAEQTPEVQEQLRAITPTSLNPEEITFLDPACGSGHILVEAYDLFKAIYQERGYRGKDIPRLVSVRPNHPTCRNEREVSNNSHNEANNLWQIRRSEPYDCGLRYSGETGTAASATKGL